MPVYDQVKQALQDILAPELQALKAEIRRLDEKIESLRNEMNTRFLALEEKVDLLRNVELKRVDEKIETLRTVDLRGVEEKFESLRNEMNARFSAVQEGLDGLKYEVRTVLEIRERLAAVEAKVGITRK